MAEISSLLGLITDDNTRQALIAQMENMFDNAPDEERLIQEIGNPTKVAVALIRYADSGKITPAAAPVVAPAQAQPRRAPQPRPRAEQYRPIAPQPAPQPVYADQAAEDTCDEQPAAPVLDGQFSLMSSPRKATTTSSPPTTATTTSSPRAATTRTTPPTARKGIMTRPIMTNRPTRRTSFWPFSTRSARSWSACRCWPCCWCWIWPCWPLSLIHI